MTGCLRMIDLINFIQKYILLTFRIAGPIDGESNVIAECHETTDLRCTA